jgi:hypothetical protein
MLRQPRADQQQAERHPVNVSLVDELLPKFLLVNLLSHHGRRRFDHNRSFSAKQRPA